MNERRVHYADTARRDKRSPANADNDNKYNNLDDDDNDDNDEDADRRRRRRKTTHKTVVASRVDDDFDSASARFRSPHKRAREPAPLVPAIADSSQ